MDYYPSRSTIHVALKLPGSLGAALESAAKAMPILTMTADAFEEDIHSAVETGTDGHIAKTLDFNTLARDISGYLGQTGRVPGSA